MTWGGVRQTLDVEEKSVGVDVCEVKADQKRELVGVESIGVEEKNLDEDVGDLDFEEKSDHADPWNLDEVTLTSRRDVAEDPSP